MSNPKGNIFARMLRGLGRVLNGFRILILNVVFFAIFFAVLAAMLSERRITIEEGIALVVGPKGEIVEQFTGDPLERAIAGAMGDEEPQARMRDLMLAIEQAANDERIKSLVIVPDQLMSAGPAQLQELAKAVARFKESGKPVYAYGDYYEQGQFYLASHADEILMNPDGLLVLEGYSRYRTYMKDGLDKLAVDVHLFRVGDYKSAGEPFVRNDMSEEAKEANRAWLGDLWETYVNDIAEARRMDPVLVRDYIDRYGARVSAAGGHAAKAAVEAGLVDGLATRDEFRSKLIELVGEDEDTHSFRQIDFESYAQSVRLTRLNRPEKKVAVVVAQGPIVEGDQPPGIIGADSTARLIRKARFDDEVEALVLRVDSGGGSAFASEVIRRELELTRKAGKPVVVSMGAVAASGGYWISMTSDRIYADSTSITGSIGVIGLFMNFPRTLDKIGLNVDGVGTTELAGAFHPGRPLDSKVADIIQQLVEQTYDQFVNQVAENRGMDPERVHEIARGRVWSGKAAAELGLVDELGGLDQALKGAAELAGLEKYRVEYVERELSPFERWVMQMSTGAMTLAGLEAGGDMPAWRWLREGWEEIQLFAGANADPRGIYSYCFCRPPPR